MSMSSLERKFDRTWTFCKGPELEREVVLVPGRRWRVDFYHRPSKTVLELEGLSFGPAAARHQNAMGFVNDCSKYTELTLLGCHVFRLTVKHLDTRLISRIIDYVRIAQLREAQCQS